MPSAARFFQIEMGSLMLVDQPYPDRAVKAANVVKNFVTVVTSQIRQMSMENPLWGAPRIHGELLKLGFEVAQSSSPSTWSSDAGRQARDG